MINMDDGLMASLGNLSNDQFRNLCEKLDEHKALFRIDQIEYFKSSGDTSIFYCDRLIAVDRLKRWIKFTKNEIRNYW